MKSENNCTRCGTKIGYGRIYRVSGVRVQLCEECHKILTQIIKDFIHNPKN